MTSIQWAERNPLFQFRKAHGYTQADIAAAMGVSHHRIYMFEKGISKPRQDQMTKLSEIVKIPNLQVIWEQWLLSRPKLN